MASAKRTSKKALVEHTSLPNGLKIITERIPSVRSASVGIWVASGSRRESEAESGISHFIEHMLFKGTTTRSAEKIAREIDSIGGNLDAFTSRELVSFNTKVLDEHIGRAWDVLADLVSNPMFREEDIAKEKSVILEEIKMDADNPEYLAHEMFSKSFWKVQAIGRPILGNPKTVKSFNKPQLTKFFERVYNPKNIVVTAAGQLKHDQIVKMVEKSFGSVKRKGALTDIEAADPQAGITLKDKPSLEQAHIILGVPSYAMPHARRFDCYVLSTILGGGMSARLFQNIREKHGLAYSVFSELNMYRDAGCLAVYAGASANTVPKVIELILAEFKNLKKEPVSHEELRRAKDNLKGSLMLGLESTSSRMANLARQEIFFNRFISMDEMLDNIEAVTAEQVMAVANRFLKKENITLAVLGPIGDLKLGRADLAC